MSAGYFYAKDVNVLKLKDTTEMMNSDDYTERFKAEYLQLRIRIEGLEEMLEGYKYNTLEFEPSCSYELLHAQLASMKAYQAVLKERARIEHIKLY